MTDRERFLACVAGRETDRPPFWLFWGPWDTTEARWRQEGMPEGADHRSPWEPDQVPQVVPVHCGPYPISEPRVLEENEDSVTFVDTWGITRRNFKGHMSMSEFIDFPVKTRQDWEQFRDSKLNPDDPGRLETNWREVCAEWQKKGWPIQLGAYPDVGIFGGLRWLLGDEECLMAFCMTPDLVHDIMDHLTTLYLTVFERVVKEVRVDVVHMWEDFCGCQGPLIGPQQWGEFVGPCYRRIRAFMDAHDIPVFSVDTDGQPKVVVPTMMEAGLNYLFPNEVAAGVDVVEYRREFPDLALMGGIDKRALAQDRAAIDLELKRIAPAIEMGRYVPDLDHLVPSDVSWSNYCYYADRLKELVGA